MFKWLKNSSKNEGYYFTHKGSAPVPSEDLEWSNTRLDSVFNIPKRGDDTICGVCKSAVVDVKMGDYQIVEGVWYPFIGVISCPKGCGYSIWQR